MARARNKPMLDEGEIITADDLRAAMQAQGVEVRQGDVVLIHTGWVELLERDPARFGPGQPVGKATRRCWRRTASISSRSWTPAPWRATRRKNSSSCSASRC